jgi:hypothetical protein
MARRRVLTVGTVLLALVGYASATGTEICGNGSDDNGDGVADEGCYPTLTTGVCESPLSCADTGMVSWATGSLHYDLPPDLAPKVPYGPGIGFRRFYLSMATPGTVTPAVNQTPLGPHWSHTYLSYLRVTTSGFRPDDIVYVHMSDGRDVRFFISPTTGTFVAQPGAHVLSLAFDSTTSTWRMQLLTGETVVYNNSGQLAEIWDTMPTPNKVLVTWDSTTNGNVSTVTDAAGLHRLLFSYRGGFMTSMQYQTFASSTWTTQHTTTFDYSNGASHDATSGWYVPANATEWTDLLAGTGLPNPSSLWLDQETSGNFADSIGSVTLTAPPGTGYFVSVPGWSRKAWRWLDTAGAAVGTLTGVPDLHSSSMMVLSLQAITNTPSATRSIMLMGAGGAMTNNVTVQYNSSDLYQLETDSTTVTGTVNHGTGVVPQVLRYVVGTGISKLFVENEVLSVNGTPPPTGSIGLGFGAEYFSSPAILHPYAAAWYGSAAELTDAQVATVISRIENGTGVLHSVTIGGQLAQVYSYDANGNMNKISDGGGTQVVAFGYSATNGGEVDRVTTSRGTVGFEYNATRTGCSGSGETMLYFNQGNTTSCSVDSDCGTGFMCGGKTGTGATGTCFLAGRCLTTSTTAAPGRLLSPTSHRWALAAGAAAPVHAPTLCNMSGRQVRGS